ncbi:anhydro-N-acetylmuramic acid kinase [Qipengyuania sp. MTN3-11]
MRSDLFIGMMSGTSADGIDVAALRTDGIAITELGPATTFAMRAELRCAIRRASGNAIAPRELIEAVTAEHVLAAKTFLSMHSISTSDVRAVGLHGQTILHRPSEGISVQIGDAVKLAAAISVDVVDQFRIQDVEAGGQGAPIAPIFHAALMRDGPLPSAIVNIGGIANVTWFDGTRIVAYDAGLGNARLDDWMRDRAGLDFDEDGKHAVKGKVHETILETALAHEYYSRMPPKSLDRDELSVSNIDRLSVEDGAATLAAISAEAIVRSQQFLPRQPERWIVVGGGRRNPAIMRRLRMKLGNVVDAEAVGLDGDAVEAHLIAYLTARKLAELPSTFPQTTGVVSPVVCGILNLAAKKAL